MDLGKDNWSDIIVALFVDLIIAFVILLVTDLHPSPIVLVIFISILMISIVFVMCIKAKNTKLTYFVGLILIILVILLVGTVVTDRVSVSNEPTATPKLKENTSTSTGSISVTSSPAGASVYLDSEYKGESPQILNSIKQGSHSITLKLAGYKDWSQDISVDAGKTVSISPTLTPISSSTGSISVTSSPIGASIFLDDTYEGETPKILEDIEQGSHTVTLTLAEYKDWSQDISVDTNKTFSISPTLTPTEVSTDISTTNTATVVETSEEDNVTAVETPKEEDTANNELTTNLKIDNLSHVTWSYSTSKSDPNVKLYEGETIVNVSVYVKGSNDVDVYTYPYYWRFISDGEPYLPECPESTFLTHYRGISPGSRDMFYLTFIIQGEPKHAELIYYLPTGKTFLS